MEECLANCAVYRWAPSTTDPYVTERQPPEPGVWNGRSGNFIYEDYGIVLEPYHWLSLGGDPGPNPGQPVYTGGAFFAGSFEWRGGVGFEWSDATGLHLEAVVVPVKHDLNLEWHTQYMWLCAQGITPPPDLLYPPEPSTWLLVASGVGALFIRRRFVHSGR